MPDIAKTVSRALSRSCTLLLMTLSMPCALGWPAIASAADQPERSPSPVPPQQELIPDLPEFPTVWSELPEPLRLFVAEPFGPLDKGGTYTDMGAGQPGRLTEREEALLALGRAAIEASRANGTLEIQRRIPTPTATENMTEEEKRESLRRPANPPVLGTGSPADFVDQAGVSDPAPLGPVPPTQAELDKLAGAHSSSDDQPATPESDPSVKEN
jgi:hypothetical protein